MSAKVKPAKRRPDKVGEGCRDVEPPRVCRTRRRGWVVPCSYGHVDRRWMVLGDLGRYRCVCGGFGGLWMGVGRVVYRYHTPYSTSARGYDLGSSSRASCASSSALKSRRRTAKPSTTSVRLDADRRSYEREEAGGRRQREVWLEREVLNASWDGEVLLGGGLAPRAPATRQSNRIIVYADYGTRVRRRRVRGRQELGAGRAARGAAAAGRYLGAETRAIRRWGVESL
ncbi:hypothetical protein CVT26_013366 [Gymnopilus dilepis]|uniref:Uncharacterized protein n=1 Tax=Gymnopilus dilepis TaxID=231916 RepID=A0A409WVB0_9AGAR|nr:hypothetical protein CVT26_013366 [Gymnopilus dilepis]